MPFPCGRCGKAFCGKHRLPSGHGCTGPPLSGGKSRDPQVVPDEATDIARQIDGMKASVASFMKPFVYLAAGIAFVAIVEVILVFPEITILAAVQVIPPVSAMPRAIKKSSPAAFIALVAIFAACLAPIAALVIVSSAGSVPVVAISMAIMASITIASAAVLFRAGKDLRATMARLRGSP